MTTRFYTDSLLNIDSEAISDLYYNKHTFELFVRFQTGSLAGYSGVNVYMWNDFKNAPSKGRFFQTHIKGTFRGLDTTGVTLSAVNVSSGSATLASRTSSNVAWDTPAKVQPEFSVEVAFDGVLTLNVKANDSAAAIARVSEILAETTTGTIKSLKVTAR